MHILPQTGGALPHPLLLQTLPPIGPPSSPEFFWIPLAVGGTYIPLHQSMCFPELKRPEERHLKLSSPAFTYNIFF